MLHTTRAVALRTFRHTDNTLVMKAYTEAFGARSYLVRTGKRAGMRQAPVQPLDRLELVVTESGDREMHTVREMRVFLPYTNLAADPVRGLVLLFAQEVFYRTLRAGAPDPPLFHFVLETLEAIDTGGDPGAVPVLLLVRLAHHLGILPQPPPDAEGHFDLREGSFTKGSPAHAFCMDLESSALFARLLHAELRGGSLPVPMKRQKVLLDQLLIYFRLHVEGFGELRSPGVLHDVLR